MVNQDASSYPPCRSALALACGVAFVLLGVTHADAKGFAPGGRGPTAKAPSSRQPMGPLHEFKRPTPLERWTNSPKTDARRGLRPHSFWVRPDRGPKGGSQYLKDKLNLDHSVKQREQMAVSPGTKYHERPTRGGTDHTREVILHNRVSKDVLELKEGVRK